YLAEHALKFNPNVTVLATGIKISDYKIDRHCERDDKVRLVWIGSKATLGYLMTIKPALEDVGSHFNNVVLRIICDDFFDLENMPVEKLRWSQETRGVDLAECDIGLAPLPNNRFTEGKCSFKVLEYAAAGLPVVASPVGTNSDYVLDSVTGFFTTNHQHWVSRITQLIKDPQLRERMGKQVLVQAERYDISVIGKQFTDLLNGCLRG
ncbi:MAG: glycosyltransferase family 4 protein, partial [Planctomycetota bacterium]|nr:glycosyltransferase family 4 protein [Planctomycetota bacterium]